MNSPSYFWAKTHRDPQGNEVPGISVVDHCLNVGCVAEAITAALPHSVLALLPGDHGRGAAVLAALHDIGKITLGFLTKCPLWPVPPELGDQAKREAIGSVSDHALVSQVHLQGRLRAAGAQLWAAAIGAHHGRPKGRTARIAGYEASSHWAQDWRNKVTDALVHVFGPLPSNPPHPGLSPAHSDLWLLAGLVTVADWIGSNEAFFPSDHGLSLDEGRLRAWQALGAIGWPGGNLVSTSFSDAFVGHDESPFSPNAVQQAVSVAEGDLVILEAPMGCGKTEAALHLAQRWIAEGRRHGLYFALPTQVTSNRIHQRIRKFLVRTLEDSARLRLAHAHSWLEEDSNLELQPSRTQVGKDDSDNPFADVWEARTWFASSKHALLAPYGVGTIDQALQGMVTVKHFFVRRFALAGKVVILDEIHSYDIYTGTLVGALVGELLNLGCSVIILSATLTAKRRQELLRAAGCPENVGPTAYPLVTCAARGSTVQHLQPSWPDAKRVELKVEAFPEEAVLEELMQRAEVGQHVLWIRNTVVESQKTFAALSGLVTEGRLRLGLLHSRFPFVRRQELEAEWLERLGRRRAPSGPGSILLATQVVEQSVDIDLDFIVSDLAPTDMLIQRLGRLWRHERPSGHRAAMKPEFWVRLPEFRESAEAGELKASLGRSAKVYAPYVLLRSARIWRNRSELLVPQDIRALLEATYADPEGDEPPGWRELLEELEAEKRKMKGNAEAAMLVLGRPMLPLGENDDAALTRRKGAPTAPVIILRSIIQLEGRGGWLLTAPDESSTTVSDFEWTRDAARFLHRWLVRIPRWQVPSDVPKPRWLTEHTGRDTVAACLEDDGHLRFGDTASPVSYHPNFGVFADRPAKALLSPQPWSDDDDEFDA